MNSTVHLTHEEINAWIDGYGTEAEMLRASQHIEACDPCRAEADSLRRTKAVFASLRDVELPRSFTLPASMAKPVQPLSSPSSTQKTGIARFEPLMRLVSIAAVLMFLVVGGLNVGGVFDDGFNTPNSETNQPTSTLNRQDQQTLAPGEVVDHGEAAAEGSGQLQNVLAQVDTPAQAVDTGLTPFDITTMAIGVIALVSIAGWILLRYRAGETG